LEIAKIAGRFIPVVIANAFVPIILLDNIGENDINVDYRTSRLMHHRLPVVDIYMEGLLGVRHTDMGFFVHQCCTSMTRRTQWLLDTETLRTAGTAWRYAL
jgi:hypothetical protein